MSASPMAAAAAAAAAHIINGGWAVGTQPHQHRSDRTPLDAPPPPPPAQSLVLLQTTPGDGSVTGVTQSDGCDRSDAR